MRAKQALPTKKVSVRYRPARLPGEAAAKDSGPTAGPPGRGRSAAGLPKSVMRSGPIAPLRFGASWGSQARRAVYFRPLFLSQS